MIRTVVSRLDRIAIWWLFKNEALGRELRPRYWEARKGHDWLHGAGYAKAIICKNCGCSPGAGRGSVRTICARMHQNCLP